MKKALQPEGLAKPQPPYSPVIVSGDLVYTAGQVAHDENGEVVSDDIVGQTKRTIENLRACLAAAGCGLEDVLKVTAFLNDLGDMAAYNEVYKEYFSEPYPARSTVGVSLPGGLRVEIEAVARRPA
jgi:2-iminobutanoate/2-iminopropanoate deaminase